MISLAAAIFFSLVLSLAKLIIKDTYYTGALKVLISLNSDLSSGQGVLFLAVFGLDQAASLLSPLCKLLRRLLLLSSWAHAGEAFVMVDSSRSSSSSSSSSESSRRTSETSTSDNLSFDRNSLIPERSSSDGSLFGKNSSLVSATCWVDCEGKAGTEVARL